MTAWPGPVVVVSNTTPISNLIRIQRLPLLAAIFGHVAIPTHVADELDRGEHVLGRWRDAPGADGLFVVAPQADPFLRQLMLDLDPGEAAAIALAVQHRALLLIDEVAGRRIAAHHGVKLTGTLGVLTEAKRFGHVPAVRPLLDALRDASFHLSSALRDRVLREAGEAD